MFDGSFLETYPFQQAPQDLPITASSLASPHLYHSPKADPQDDDHNSAQSLQAENVNSEDEKDDLTTPDKSIRRASKSHPYKNAIATRYNRQFKESRCGKQLRERKPSY